MSRIGETFRRLKHESKKGFIPFVTAGDPSVSASKSIVLKLASLGADIIELGVPFSDPMADGPTIQLSSERAVAAGVTLRDVLNLTAEIRRDINTPVVLFSYFNPIFRMGLERFAEEAAAAGVAGLLLTDVVGHEAGLVQETLAEAGIDLISLVAPTTSDDRLDEICRNARGFIYAVSRAGVTGSHADPGTVEKLVHRVRSRTDLPVAVGFGISRPEHIETVWQYADAAVVGSAIVSEIEKNADDPVAAVERIVRQLLPTVANPTV